MKQLKKIIPGTLFCLGIAIPAWQLGKFFPIIGGPVFGILMGMIITMFFPNLLSKSLYIKQNSNLLNINWKTGLNIHLKNYYSFQLSSSGLK
jgi:uncharacterized membrane protein YadS